MTTISQPTSFCSLTLTAKISNKISQRLPPKHAACGVAQSPYPIYSQGKTNLSKQLLWHAAGDSSLACGRSLVRALAPTGTLHTFFSTPFLLGEIGFFFFFCIFPTTPMKMLRLIDLQCHHLTRY